VALPVASIFAEDNVGGCVAQNHNLIAVPTVAVSCGVYPQIVEVMCSS